MYLVSVSIYRYTVNFKNISRIMYVLFCDWLFLLTPFFCDMLIPLNLLNKKKMLWICHDLTFPPMKGNWHCFQFFNGNFKFPYLPTCMTLSVEVECPPKCLQQLATFVFPTNSMWKRFSISLAILLISSLNFLQRYMTNVSGLNMNFCDYKKGRNLCFSDVY